MRYDPTEFGKRLQEEVGREGLSVRDLERKVQVWLTEKGLPVHGSSRGNLSTYLNGDGPEGEPRRHVVQALAAVFSSPGWTVRPEFLLYGGPKTVEDAASEAEARTHAPVLDLMRERVPELERLPYRFTVSLLDHAGRRAYGGRGRNRTGGPRSPLEQQEEVLAYVEEVWKEISGPLSGASFSDYAVFDYLEAALHARNLALRIPTTSED